MMRTLLLLLGLMAASLVLTACPATDDDDSTDDDATTDDDDATADDDDTTADDDDTTTDDDDTTSDDDDAAPTGLEAILGNWIDGWGSLYSIEESVWTLGTVPEASTFEIGAYSDDDQWLIAQPMSFIALKHAAGDDEVSASRCAYRFDHFDASKSIVGHRCVDIEFRALVIGHVGGMVTYQIVAAALNPLDELIITKRAAKQWLAEIEDFAYSHAARFGVAVSRCLAKSRANLVAGLGQAFDEPVAGK